MDKNEKPWYEKVGSWVGIIAGICAILSFIITLLNNPSKSNVDQKIIDSYNEEDDIFDINGDENIIIQGDNNVNIDLGKNTSSVPVSPQENKTSKDEEIPEFDFGKEIRYIHKNEIIINKKIINNKKNKSTYSSIYPGVTFSQISNKVRLIEVAKKFRNIKCSRLYHFDEKAKLTFALIEDNKGEHRLYFYNDRLIRYIDIDNKVHDINYDLESFNCKWVKLALKESYEIFNGI